MSPAQARRLVDRACSTKTPMGRAAARRVAARFRADQPAGEPPVRAYRCPFRHPDSYHVGRAPAWATVEQLAAVLRMVGAGDLELEDAAA